MARKLADIRQFLVDTLVSKAAAVGLTVNPLKWSAKDYKLLMLDTVATAEATEEQLWDQFSTQMDSQISKAAPESNEWIRNQILNKFQFDATTPQVVGIYPPDFSPTYPVNNDALKIVKFCTVKTGVFGTTLIKAAASVNGLPADLDTTYGAGTLDTLKAFVAATTDDCITKVVTSGIADKLWLQLDIYYNGLYANVIQANVINGITTFLNNLPFDGIFLISDLEVYLKSIAGVNDCVIQNARCRADSLAFPSGTDLVVSSAITNRLYNPASGFIILENSVGNTLTDPRPATPSLNNLNLIAQ